MRDLSIPRLYPSFCALTDQCHTKRLSVDLLPGHCVNVPSITEYNFLPVRCRDIDYAVSAVLEDELASTVLEYESASTVSKDELASTVPEDESASAVSEDAPELSDEHFIKVIRELPGDGSLNFEEKQKITGPRVRDIKELKYLTKNICNLGYFIPRLVVGLPSSNTGMKEQSRRSVGYADKPREIKNSKLRSGKQTLGRRMSEAGGRRKDPYLLSNQMQLCKIRQRKTLDSRNQHVSRLVVPKF
nr:hypothetical protein [Tanacetum cinerariifolium]